MKKLNYYNDLFYMDETSPSGIRWKIDIKSGKYKKKVEKCAGDVAGVASVNGKTSYWKVQFSVAGKRYYTTAHIVIWTLLHGGYEKPYVVDHIDGDGLNNNVENLRLVTTEVNSRNMKKNVRNSSGYTGVYFMECSYCSYWVAYWRENKRSRSKCFRIDLNDPFSSERELQKAIQFRKGKLDINSSEGWTNRHGE